MVDKVPDAEKGGPKIVVLCQCSFVGVLYEARLKLPSQATASLLCSHKLPVTNFMEEEEMCCLGYQTLSKRVFSVASMSGSHLRPLAFYRQPSHFFVPKGLLVFARKDLVLAPSGLALFPSSFS